MKTQTKESQRKLKPDEIIQILKEGNKRFVSGQMEERDLLAQVKITSQGQYPHTVVLGCIDSRATSEQIFDQGIGDIFNTRIAGNVIDENVLGSLEFSCKIAGVKVILVLGHTKCEAVSSACKNVVMGHVTALLNKIQPAVNKVRPSVEDVCSVDSIDKVAAENVVISIREITARSVILKEMSDAGIIKIIGGMYDVDTGIVDFIIPD